ncbi:hypothetical protein PILCRDRAFT_541309 [Piloderma croceum F 1598]|uniref:Uncharacterized protein n=1 Tax=Piloderma croceum (strain F 1598) TaxID=765440 RepID=A0A0C3F5G7_PILCF|nr:hypothetical protein PILCRDRAFT_541309 [Piloderma croceum F 1598]
MMYGKQNREHFDGRLLTAQGFVRLKRLSMSRGHSSNRLEQLHGELEGWQLQEPLKLPSMADVRLRRLSKVNAFKALGS